MYIRVEHAKDKPILLPRHLDDLSLSAIGILALILSSTYGDFSVISDMELSEKGKITKTTVQRYLRELEIAGYIERETYQEVYERKRKIWLCEKSYLGTQGGNHE